MMVAAPGPGHDLPDNLSDNLSDDITQVFYFGEMEAVAGLGHWKSLLRDEQDPRIVLAQVNDTHQVVIGRWDDTATMRAVDRQVARSRYRWLATFEAVGDVVVAHLTRRVRRRKKV